MMTAAVALTANGAALAADIGRRLPADVFVKAGRHELSGGAFEEFSSLKAIMPKLMGRYDAVLFIMAAGIAVRMIAPYIVHKTTDPAVVVLDEKGRHAISLLAGHLGGANALARRAAGLVGAAPVITTATDVNGRTAADTAAAQLGLRIAQIENLKHINADIAAGKSVKVYVDAQMPDAAFYLAALEEKGLPAAKAKLRELKRQETAVVITAADAWPDWPQALILFPGRLAAGIGCRRGASREDILKALQKACRLIGKDLKDIVSLASTVIKSGEGGLLDAAAQLNVPIYFYGHEEIQAAIQLHRLCISEFVCQQIGVGNVCESTALLSSQSKKLILRKTKYSNVTVALAWEK